MSSRSPSEIPEPVAVCPVIEPAEVMRLLRAAPPDPGEGFLLVDVRGGDFQGGTIATSLNLPAQSFFQTRPTIHRMCRRAGIRKVILYCGSCGTRGPRCAGWLQDWLDEVGEREMQVLVLQGGIKGWQKTYGGEAMDFYAEHAWQ